MRRSVALFLGLAAAALAQDTIALVTDSSTPTSTDSFSSTPTTSSTNSSVDSRSITGSSSTDGPITHTIAVAKGGHTFVPDVTQAEVGDIILFQFYPTNHSVIRAEYGYPCIPYEDTGVDKTGFFSGFWPVDAILEEPPSWSLSINDTNPIFFYCGATGSCINYQMVGVINPNATTSLEAQKQLAKDSTFMLLPGEPWPNEEEDPFTTASAAPTSTSAAAAAATSSATATSETSTGVSSSHHSLSAGAIAGIAIGAAAVALAAAVLLYMCGRQSRHTPVSKFDDRPGTGHGTMQQVPFSPHSHGHMSSYMDPTKHMSMHSSVVGVGAGPALPGYAPSHDPNMSPPLHPAYSVSDSLYPGPLAPGSDIGSPHSPSPSQMFSVPAYSSDAPQSLNSTPHHAVAYSSVPPPHIHEMAAPEPIPPQLQAGDGIMGLIRRSSLSKSGGVERYG